MFISLLTHQYPLTDMFNIGVSGLIFYLILYGHLNHQEKYILWGILVVDLMYFISAPPHQGVPPAKHKRRVHFAPVVQWRTYEPQKAARTARVDRVDRTASPPQVYRPNKDFFPAYMNYSRPDLKPKAAPGQPFEPEIDNRKQYDDVSADNVSILSSFADSFARSDSESSGEPEGIEGA